MTVMKRLLCLALLVNLGCFTVHSNSNDETAAFLANVENPDDPRLPPVIDRVLSDVEEGTFRYDDQVRKYAFDAIRLLPRDIGIRKRVRLIAARPIPTGRSWHAVLEFVAVLGALGVLTELQDAEAVRLNQSRLTDPLLEYTAVGDLRLLRAWSATAEVEWSFKNFRHRPVRDPATLASYLLFLAESPSTSTSICTDLVHSLPEIESCCPREHEIAIDLVTRLSCSTANPQRR
jgi:hypothetical protein